MDLSEYPIIDHHAHPFLRGTGGYTAVQFQRWFSESTEERIHAGHVPHTIFFRTAVRWLAEVLVCEPTVDAVLAARAAQDEREWAHRLFRDARIEALLCDYGYGSGAAYDHAEMQQLVPCRVEPILRLERAAETLILRHETFMGFIDDYVEMVRGARAAGYVALKSILAYRTGLQIEPVTREEAEAEFTDVKEEARRQGDLRLENKTLCDYLVTLALEEAARQEMPFQFHTGFGDADADLRTVNPLHLRPVVEQYAGVPFVLLHAGWPYYRELAHMAAIYGNVWLDVSLAIPFATAGIPPMLTEVLGMAPASKVLFATDAFTMPEIFWLAARWGRWGLGRVLEQFVADDLLTAREAEGVASAILSENARGLYFGRTVGVW